MLTVLEKSNDRAGAFRLPEGISFAQIKDVFLDGLQIPTTEYHPYGVAEVYISCAHPLHIGETIEIDM